VTVYDVLITVGETRMDTSDFDKQAKSHLEIYNGFMTASKIVIGLVIVVLVAMAASLL
jgi:hypothetical protein